MLGLRHSSLNTHFGAGAHARAANLQRIRTVSSASLASRSRTVFGFCHHVVYLRRHMRPDLMTALVDDVMTKNPKTISRDLLASEALEILNSSKITALIVTDASRPVGIVHLHDILRAGVA